MASDSDPHSDSDSDDYSDSSSESFEVPVEHDVLKAKALAKAFSSNEPFCSGICAVRDHQLLLYYTQDDIHRRIDFADVKPDDLDILYRACKPAEFGRNGESVFDETYRKAGKMDLSSFSTLFDPRSLGIHERIVEGLLISKPGLDYGVVLELYKLNVYGKGDFFKLHKDTPRSERMLGSLVVVLPTKHEGGQLVLHQGDKQWNIDFTKEFAAATEPSVCFIAFFGDIEHEVLPVTSGHRVTLTYNIYHNNAPKESLSRIQSPFYQTLKAAMVDFVNDGNTLPRGGYLGFGLIQEYVFDREGSVEPILHSLKGSDRALLDVCNELKLRCSVKLLYSDLCDDEIDLITDRQLTVWDDSFRDEAIEWLEDVLFHFTIKEVEGVEIIGRERGERYYGEDYDRGFLDRFYRDPVTQILEVRHMSSVETDTSYVCFGNEPHMDHFYGKACLLVAVDPFETRQPLIV